MNNAANERGYTVTVMSTDQDTSVEQASLDFLFQHGIKGFAITTAWPTVEAVQLARERGMFPLLVAQHPLNSDLGWLGIDDYASMSVLADHVLSTGRNKIAFIDGPSQALQHEQRRRAVYDAVIRAGLDPSKSLTQIKASNPDIEGGEAAMLELLDAVPNIDTVMCINDYTAMGAISGLRIAGRSIPDDVAVTGFDDIDATSLLSVPLTTVHQPMEKMGTMAANLLIDAIEGVHTKLPQISLESELIIRESTEGELNRS